MEVLRTARAMLDARMRTLYVLRVPILLLLRDAELFFGTCAFFSARLFSSFALFDRFSKQKDFDGCVLQYDISRPSG